MVAVGPCGSRDRALPPRPWYAWGNDGEAILKAYVEGWEPRDLWVYRASRVEFEVMALRIILHDS